ncbi:MAG: universal stress protein UspA-like protein [Solidesulfovibrio magneticus str. Maddingley MBC34]|uniref:Universal stress protein UspA-like protein n=1 Tax=Solidesulfovibrio magneticus str. Maddingley MBC34 TaxID=1206767 RepID=K6FH98_9BACT|nr:MAG: universal stress protein UspA-like protein [Solidesulfovibrio magneticus str. Maddingley MBC34]
MFNKILFATTGSPECDSAARVAFDMARQYGSKLTLFHVLGIPGKGDSNLVIDTRTGEEVDADAEYLEGVAEELRTTYANQLEALPGVEIEVAVGVPSREVLRIARAKDVDMIVLCGPSEGQQSGFYKRGVVGDNLRKVAKAARCPVLTVSRPSASFWGGFSNIVFATDFSKASESAFQFAKTVVKAVDGELHMFHCVDLSRFQSPIALTQDGIEAKLAESRRRLHHEYATQLGDFKSYTSEVWEGTPYVEIVKFARERQADLIVMAHHARDVDPDERPFGSTLEQVIVRATCPVVSVNRPDKLPQAAEA